jgi:hypothetical protein
VVLTSFGKNEWFAPLAGAFLLLNAVQGVVTGGVMVIYRAAKRREDGLLFWVSVISSGILGIAAILSAFM